MSLPRTGVARGCNVPVLYANHLRALLPGNRGRGVSGSIIYDNDLMRLVKGFRRVANGGNTSANPRFLVVCWNDERNHCTSCGLTTQLSDPAHGTPRCQLVPVRKHRSAVGRLPRLCCRAWLGDFIFCAPLFFVLPVARPRPPAPDPCETRHPGSMGGRASTIPPAGGANSRRSSLHPSRSRYSESRPPSCFSILRRSRI